MHVMAYVDALFPLAVITTVIAVFVLSIIVVPIAIVEDQLWYSLSDILRGISKIGLSCSIGVLVGLVEVSYLYPFRPFGIDLHAAFTVIAYAVQLDLLAYVGAIYTWYFLRRTFLQGFPAGSRQAIMRWDYSRYEMWRDCLLLGLIWSVCGISALWYAQYYLLLVAATPFAVAISLAFNWISRARARAAMHY